MTSSSKFEKEAENALHQGGSRALNIYTGVPSNGSAGFSTFPWDYSKLSVLDGVMIHFWTLPGSLYQDYNHGIVAVHEVGHWLGLYHTFMGGCNAKGDLVADTPEEKNPANECSADRDSCLNDPGLDPVHNYMDYTFDPCAFEFTPGQVERMKATYATYRAG